MHFSELRERVLQKTPVLKDILATDGNRSLLSYMSEGLGSPPTVSVKRQEEVFDVVDELVGRLIGKKVAEETIAQLKTHYRVSTGDHHHPLTHPFSAHSALVTSMALRDAGCSVLPIFSCAGISLNNSSSPRGLLLHTPTLRETRLPFFTLCDRHAPVYGLRPYKKNRVPVLKRHVRALPGLSKTQKQLLTRLITKVYAKPALFAHPHYADQITTTNFHLWKQVPGEAATDLVFLAQETVVVELLLRYHLGKDTALGELLTNPSWITAFEKCFDGIIGASSSHTKKGTALFWAIRKGERLALRQDDRALTSHDKTYRVELRASALRAALERKELMPAMSLSFSVLAFYYGIECGGGFSQVSYLPRMQAAYEKCMKLLANSADETIHLGKLNPSRLAADIAFLDLAADKKRVPATTIDLLLYGNTDTPKLLRGLAQTCTLAEAIDGLVPLFYKIMYHAEPPAMLAAPRDRTPLYV